MPPRTPRTSSGPTASRAPGPISILSDGADRASGVLRRRTRAQARMPACRPARPLVIHGLWPESTASRARIRTIARAPRLDLEPALALELADFMPGMADGLHEHEWRKHGGCSGLDDDDYFRARARAGARAWMPRCAPRLTTLAGRRNHAGGAARRRRPVPARARRARSRFTAARCATRRRHAQPAVSHRSAPVRRQRRPERRARHALDCARRRSGATRAAAEHSASRELAR